MRLYQKEKEVSLKRPMGVIKGVMKKSMKKDDDYSDPNNTIINFKHQ